jgi:hypothetical protein
MLESEDNYYIQSLERVWFAYKTLFKISFNHLIKEDISKELNYTVLSKPF